ncbi:MAG: hypothetical protein L6R38_006490 [Xanthoria sp. 2 TBL-2021]|nr:MAG: hypothetical protein L6R38_006490 [Xanthoria sp. 2 TBL-2021]
MTSKDAPTQPQSQPINLSTLPIPQLTSIKNQLTQELQHLTNSFTQLRTAQAKFRDCIKSIRDGIEKGAKTQGAAKPILVPLTPSLYVPGTLASTETVLVDIGTGFYVEKTPPAARQFYTAKVEELGKNLKDLETIVQGKQGNLTVVEDGMFESILRGKGYAGADESWDSVTAEDD